MPPGREGGRGVEARMWGSAAAEKLALHWYCYTSLQWQESPPTQASELAAVAASGGSRVHPETCIGSALGGINPRRIVVREEPRSKSDLVQLCCFPKTQTTSESELQGAR